VSQKKIDRGTVLKIDLGATTKNNNANLTEDQRKRHGERTAKFGKVVGHEQGEARPCIVLRHFKDYKLVWIVPVTSKRKAVSSHFGVELPKTGVLLRTTSYALCNHIRCVSEDRIVADANFEEKVQPRSIEMIASVVRDLI